MKSRKPTSQTNRVRRVNEELPMELTFRSRTKVFNHGSLVLLGIGLLMPFHSVPAQNDGDLRQDHPNRYVVQEGDTLWDIANKFLHDPWRWPLIWRENDYIENPHLIFPGDLLVVTGDHRIKTVRLEPQIYAQALERAIPTIPPHITQPYLTSATIVEPGELELSGHVLSGVEDEIILGQYSKFYARNLIHQNEEFYQIFRIGRAINDPESGELLGVEGIHLGDANMIRRGDDVSKLMVISSNQEIRPMDRLLPVIEEAPLPYYQPHAPESTISGWIVHAPKGVSEVGRYDIVVITGGSDEGLEEGHVLKALYHRGERKDPVTGKYYQVPDEVSGIMMVFRAYKKLSYALIMEATRSISVGDKYESP